MTIEEFESVVGDYFGDRVESYDHKDGVSSVTFVDGITAGVYRNYTDRTAREGIFFLCDMWAGMDAALPVSDAWIKEAIKLAREVLIGKLIIDGNWDDGSWDEDEDA